MNQPNLIDGVWIAADDARTIDVLDAATDEVIATVPDVGEAETRRAVDAAASSLDTWSTTPPESRIAIVRRLAEVLEHRTDHLASIIVRENGKPRREAMAEVAYAASFFPAAADAMASLEDEPLRIPGKTVVVRHRPVGVCAAITPWNFPLAMLAKKTAPALAAGCPQVVKPAEQTPLSAIAFAEIAMEAGVPAGALGLVTGDPATIGRTLLEDERVRKLSFTGSTEVGRILMRGAASNITRLSLELGGHAPFLVFDDVDLDEALRIAMAAKFRNGGQTCISPNRFLVHRAIHDEFAAALATKAASLRSGPGDRTETDLGPLIEAAAVTKVERHIQDAVKKGGRLLTGGGRRRVEGCVDRFPEPAVLTGCTPEMLCWREETFGPLCPIAAFDDEETAIRMANDSHHGLAAYAVTRDHDRMARLGRRLEAGIIGINDPAPGVARVPFGGLKHSGFGREGGRWGLAEYLEPITVSIAS